MTRDLITSLDQRGDRWPAETLKDGFSRLNGLGDGWGEFLDSVKKVLNDSSSHLSEADKQVLRQIFDAAYYAVYRRKRNQWWKFWAG